MSMAPVRIAGAEGMAIGGKPTVLRIRATQERGLTYGILAIGGRHIDGKPDAFTIDWGDGSVTTIKAAVMGSDNMLYAGQQFSQIAGYSFYKAYVHTYALPREYRVTIDSRAEFFVSSAGHNNPEVPEYDNYAKLLEAVESWGSSMFTGAYPKYLLEYARDVGGSVFRGCKNLTSIAKHEFSYILPYSFDGCGESLISPEPVVGQSTSIFKSAFYNSPFINTSWWPSSNGIVPDRCFEKCQNLSTISLPDVTAVSFSAFRGCSKLSSISLPSCTLLGQNAFEGCSSLTSLAGVEKAGAFLDYCFKDCTSLTTMNNLDDRGVPLENTDENPLQALSVTSLGAGCFSGCTSITSLISFPPYVTQIPSSCFSGCTGLKSGGINIPGQVTIIWANAFSGVGARNISFREPEIKYNSEVVRPARVPKLTRIDRGAFFGQDETGDLYTYMNTEKIKSIGGVDAEGSIASTTSPMIVKWSNYNTPYEIKEWFRSSAPSWAPWGVGKGWNIHILNDEGNDLITTGTGLENHKQIICDDFVAPPNVGWAGTSPTRLEALYLKIVKVNKNFSPYSDLQL